MTNSKSEPKNESVYAFLYKNRTPFARAALFGENEGSECVCGSIEFFSTPLGILVHAELCGLPSRKKTGVYHFCVREIGKSECASTCQRRSLCALMPVAYEKDGKAECTVLTRRILPSDLVGKRISVYERRRGCPKDEALAIAIGNIECL